MQWRGTITKLSIGLIVWLGLNNFLNAQNLVPNSSFEAFKKQSCQFLIFLPNDSTSQNIGDYVQDWYAPTGGTSDPWFYNDTLNIGPPPSNQCTQNLKRFGIMPHTGRHCVGINNSVPSVGTIASTPYREYVQTQLGKPLRQGTIYRVEFYVLRSPEAGSASNNLGALLTTRPIQRREPNFRSFGNLLSGKPQINQQQVINHIGEWTRISGCFQADSAYQYITLGNFFNDQQTTYQSDPSFGYQTRLCYYLIDDVSVTEVNANYLPASVSLGSDTTLCPKVTYRFNLPTLENLHYRWQDGDTSAHYTVRQSGIYWVEANIGGCTSRDTVKVTVEKPLVLPADTIVCSGEKFWLRPTQTDGPLLWSNGSTQDSLLIQQTGSYWVRSTSSVCSLTDTIRVQVLDCPGEVPNVFTPNGDGKNDTFFIKDIDLVHWELQIYNRWGIKVYQSYPYHNEWDGTNSPSGTYYYWLGSSTLKRQLKGWVSIIR